MLVPHTQLLQVINVYFPLALPSPKGINVEITAQVLARQGGRKSDDEAHRAESMEHRVKDLICLILKISTILMI